MTLLLLYKITVLNLYHKKEEIPGCITEVLISVRSRISLMRTTDHLNYCWAVGGHYASRRWAQKIQLFTFPTPIGLYIAVLRNKDAFAFGISILPSI